MRIKAQDFRIGNTGENILGTAVIAIMEDGASVKHENNIVEEVHSHCSDPVDLHKAGTKSTYKFVITGVTLADIQRQLNVSEAVVNATGLFVLPGQDFCYLVINTNGLRELWYCKDFYCDGVLDIDNKLGNKSFVPLSLISTANSVVEEWADIRLINDQSALATTTIKLTIANGEKAVIDWGDDNLTYITGTGAEVTYTHDYVATGSYTVKVMSDVNDIETITCGNSFVVAKLIDFRRLVNLSGLDLSGIDLAYSSVAKLSDWKDATIDLSSAGLTATEVDNILIDIDAAMTTGATGSLDISGTNASRTSNSDTAKSSLTGKGFSVTVNEA